MDDRNGRVPGQAGLSPVGSARPPRGGIRAGEFRLPHALLKTLEFYVAEGYVVVVVPASAEAADDADMASVRTCGHVEIDSTGHEARCRGTVIGLTELEFRLLRRLVSRPDRAWTYKELSEDVWGVPYFGDAGPLRSSVKRLRRKLDDLHARVVIQAVRGYGFRLLAEGADEAR